MDAIGENCIHFWVSEFYHAFTIFPIPLLRESKRNEKSRWSELYLKNFCYLEISAFLTEKSTP